MDDEAANREFWHWALGAYGRPGAQAVLLALQDEHGGDVMAALWAAAAAAWDRRLTEAERTAFFARTAALRAEAARRRAERRALKTAGDPVRYAAAKAAELAAARAGAAAAPDPAAAGADAATPAMAHNLALMLQGLHPPVSSCLINRLTEILGAR